MGQNRISFSVKVVRKHPRRLSLVHGDIRHTEQNLRTRIIVVGDSRLGTQRPRGERDGDSVDVAIAGICTGHYVVSQASCAVPDIVRAHLMHLIGKRLSARLTSLCRNSLLMCCGCALFQAGLITKHAGLVTRITAEIQGRYTSLQKQHQEFAAHLNSQAAAAQQQLDTYKQQLTQAQQATAGPWENFLCVQLEAQQIPFPTVDLQLSGRTRRNFPFNKTV